MRRGVSLLELIIVVIVIAILASIALPIFSKARERSLDKEAIAHLKLVQAGQRIYRMEWGTYYPNSGSADASGINTYLKLALPETSAWTISVNSTATATATRPDRTWTLPVSGAGSEYPTCSGAGCS